MVYFNSKVAHMFELETLKRLKENSIEINKHLKDINNLIDSQISNVDGMCDITLRVKKAFSLYKTLVNEMEEQMKDSTKDC